jgi:polyisoprenyl-teichoic acid--peptidoglycan teichoic acid transferase
VRWVLTAAWAAFVVGGFVAGWTSVRNFAWLAQTAGARTSLVATPPRPGPEPLVSQPRLRDFDETPPPFPAAGPSQVLAKAGKAQAQLTVQPSSPAGHLTILLMGIDQRPDEAAPGGDPGRTDTMLLASIDFDAHTATLASIPRDGFVVIPGHGNERVNAAYPFGELDQPGTGPDLAKRTVSQLFGVAVDRYALVDIHSMEQIIDTLGGVWIDNPYRLLDKQYPTDDYRTITIDIPAGHLHLDGVTAVEYARTRHPDSDYGRQSRQQQVLLAIRNQALLLETLPRLPRLVPEVLHLVRTDLGPVEIGQLVSFGRGLSSGDVITLPPNPELTPSYTGPGGAAYINLTPAYRAAVRAMVLEPRAAAERAQIGVYNAGAPPGSGGRAADLLARAGVLVRQITTAPPVTATRIEAGSAARHSAEVVARVLGLPADALVLSGDSSSVRVLLGPDAHLSTG